MSENIFEERKKDRFLFLKQCYDQYFKNSMEGVIIDVLNSEGKEKLYEYLVDKKLITKKGHGVGKREYKITVNGIDVIEKNIDITKIFVEDV